VSHDRAGPSRDAAPTSAPWNHHPGGDVAVLREAAAGERARRPDQRALPDVDGERSPLPGTEGAMTVLAMTIKSRSSRTRSPPLAITTP
jgi:hypothetical protein